MHNFEALGVEGLDPVEVLVGESCRLHAISDHRDKDGVVNSELPMCGKCCVSPETMKRAKILSGFPQPSCDILFARPVS